MEIVPILILGFQPQQAENLRQYGGSIRRESLKVFISWSGDRSKVVAEALKEWLPEVIQSIKPWVSSQNIDAGARWNINLAEELEACNFGIICVTQDNQYEPWLLFEAGALAKTVQKSLVCPYLIDLEISQLQCRPLSQFQAKRADKESTWELIKTIYSNVESGISNEQQLKHIFHRSWPDLEKKLNNIPKTEKGQGTERPIDDMTKEILELVRGIVSSYQQEGTNSLRRNLRQINSYDSLDSKWKSLLDEVTERRPMIGGFLQSGNPVFIDKNILLIMFSKQDDFFRTNLIERENLSVLHASAEAVFGYSLQIRLIGVD